MTREKLVVIGGVAAGMSAASRARRRNPELEIMVLEKGRHVSYSACGLPFYISGQIANPDDLIVYTQDFFRRKRDIDVQLETEVTRIEPGRKIVHALRTGSQHVTIPYDKLVIATGASPAIAIPGADLPGVFTATDLKGTSALRRFLDERRPTTAVIVGSGYIGLEFADAFARQGLRVTMLGRSPVLLEGFEPEIAGQAEEVLQSNGVQVKKNCAVNSITSSPLHHELFVHHSSGSDTAGVVLLATGLVPQTSLAEDAGIRIGSSGAIAVDERMLTSVNSIYAAGDCTETTHLVSGRPVYFPLGTTANKQGRVAGENAAGGFAQFHGIVGTLMTKAFELEIARTGLSMGEARAAGLAPESVTIHSTSHAKYLGGKPLVATLIWSRESLRLLGFQVAGPEGAAKRVDAAAVALHAKLRLEDLLHLDLGYAPPFAPVWEALLIAASEAVKKGRRA
jgi:NADPH-dependent 2,4-dienoyl-CoA reductase/sulfur reductase-like enzyme